MYKTALKLSAK